MIREYYVVARYLARIPESGNAEDSIYKELEADLNRIIKYDRQNELKDMFTIIAGSEITEEDYEND